MNLSKLKILIFIFGVILLTNNVTAQNFDIVGEEYLSPFPGPYGIKFIDSNTLKLYWYSVDAPTPDWDSEKEFTYNLIYEYGIPYIVLNDDIPEDIELGIYSDSEPRVFGEKILFLVGQVPNQETIFVSGEKYYPKVAIGYTVPENSYGSHIFLLDIPRLELTSRIYKDPSSFLKEFGIEYKIENLNDLESDTPWVEGADGYGIGESFIIENSWDDIYSSLFIINGFISADRPRLYTQNGRIKKIRVEGLDSGDIGYCNVLDTPHPQTVDISFIKEAEDIKITIMEVFEGTKYEDTAIHYMITYDKEIIPYTSGIDMDMDIKIDK